MSTIEIVRIPGDAAQLEAVIRAHTPEFEALAEQAKAIGCLHHRFVASRDELVLIDEWQDIGAAVTKWWGRPDAMALLREAGVQLPFHARHYRSIRDTTEF